MVRAAALAFLILAAPASADQALDDAWADLGKGLTKDDVPKELLDLMILTVEGQFYLSYCADHMGPGEMAEGRAWFTRNVRNNPHPFIRAQAAAGDESYREGWLEAQAEPPTLELCLRTMDDFGNDFDAALSAATSAMVDPTGARVE